MKVEIPEYRRCCCCLPLRYGLLAWGNFKMIVDAYIIAIMSIVLIQTVIWSSVYRLDGDTAMSVMSLAVSFTDSVATIMFIVGGHKINAMLIRVFYHVSIAMWIFTFLLTAAGTVITINNAVVFGWTSMEVSFYYVLLVVQTYFLILLRSENSKLQSLGDFKFVKNAADAECTMKYEEPKEESGIEVV